MYRILHIPSGEYVTSKYELTTSKGYTKYYFNPKNFKLGDEIALYFFKWSASFALWRLVPKSRRTEYLVVEEVNPVDPNDLYD